MIIESVSIPDWITIEDSPEPERLNGVRHWRATAYAKCGDRTDRIGAIAIDSNGLRSIVEHMKSHMELTSSTPATKADWHAFNFNNQG